MEELFTKWTLLGGFIFNTGYVISLVTQIKNKESRISNLSFTLFAIATVGYIGYFTVVQPDSFMALIADVGLILIMANISVSLFYGKAQSFVVENSDVN